MGYLAECFKDFVDKAKVFVPEFVMEVDNCRAFVRDFMMIDDRYTEVSMFLYKKQWYRTRSRLSSELVYALRNDLDEFAEILIPNVSIKDIVSICKIALSNNNKQAKIFIPNVTIK